ncbi:hypothetical protein SFLOR_v1c08420 [Spiroplasma floricola 23-6]|uniref:Uncharacterized protein n=1 Tax=Spiroplasma floricola 23-6 TaxID=1336749 RepID=A0A2K8SGF6_9MOLU|nr:hypothetical protein SFLOR_v1c08420 [Spiroplasma floricola 23-6]
MINKKMNMDIIPVKNFKLKREKDFFVEFFSF